MRDEKLAAHDEMVNRIGNLQEQNVRLRKKLNTFEAKQKNHAMILPLSVAAAAVAGGAISYALLPATTYKKDCYVYKVAQTPVTAFVLKPPSPLHLETPVCPATQKCEAKENAVPPEEQKAAAEEEEAPRRKRYRRHRFRSRWR